MEIEAEGAGISPRVQQSKSQILQWVKAEENKLSMLQAVNLPLFHIPVLFKPFIDWTVPSCIDEDCLYYSVQ